MTGARATASALLAGLGTSARAVSGARKLGCQGVISASPRQDVELVLTAVVGAGCKAPWGCQDPEAGLRGWEPHALGWGHVACALSCSSSFSHPLWPRGRAWLLSP